MSGGERSGGWLWRGAPLICVLALAGCGATIAPSPGDTRVTSLMSEADKSRLTQLAEQRVAANSDPDQGYRIGPDDLLEITIPDLMDASPYHRTTPSGTTPGVPAVEAGPAFREGVRVSALGDITVPQLGVVPAAGLTARGLEAEIATRLKEAGILHRPEVTVTTLEHRSHVVAVVGSLQRPGLFPITRPNATIADMIWAAGGPSREAGRIVQFTPATVEPPSYKVAGDAPAAVPAGDSVAPIRIDLEMLLRSSEAGTVDINAPVRPGDVISIAPAGIVLVDGWVQKPGAYPVTRNLTLTGTIASAGGLNFAADKTRATVKRSVSPTEEYFMTVDLDAVDARTQSDVPIIDGDVVYLPASAPKLVPWGIWQFFSTIFRIGASVVAF